ncbi:hypothetical protein T4E_1420 [Trichinella pseudospiralis]|uniref:Uncharacterized protein n=1 Tax=Trichinella pseudospiralis TaxID=6337 RepID=A0A0V0XSY3_TRIPS|nr:hypothetical protein T4E_1420 [Trichinella pseudospiralis]
MSVTLSPMICLWTERQREMERRKRAPDSGLSLRCGCAQSVVFAVQQLVNVLSKHGVLCLPALKKTTRTSGARLGSVSVCYTAKPRPPIRFTVSHELLTLDTAR